MQLINQDIFPKIVARSLRRLFSKLGKRFSGLLTFVCLTVGLSPGVSAHDISQYDELAPFNNAAVIGQSGELLEADLYQQGVNNLASVAQLGGDNRVVLRQVGESNQAFLSQNGALIEANLLQTGVNNLVVSTQLGSELELDIEQLGNDNQAYVVQSGYDNDVEIYQHGSGHSVVVTQWGSLQNTRVTQGYISQ